MFSGSAGAFFENTKKWHLQALQCLNSNAEFVREERDGFLVLRRRTVEAVSAVEFLLPNPDLAFAAARILKPGSRTHAGVVEVNGRQYVLKRYNCRGWVYRLVNAFRRSRAVRTWLINWEFLVRGIPVPEPLVCLEERRCRLLERSYILMEFVDEADSLRDRWRQLATRERERLSEFLGCFLGHMHRSGMLHGDLKWDNILVGANILSPHARLVDLDGSSTMPHFSLIRARKDFFRFLKDLDKESGELLLRDAVQKSWEKALK